MSVPGPGDLLALADSAADASYSPYSNYRVGAAVVTSDGDVYTGANIENAAYGASVCAETNAITTAAADGARGIETVAVVCKDSDTCTPCGNCRQVMREFGVKTVIVRDITGAPRQISLSDLLPESFGPEFLD